jgi:hypothetical protein
MLKTIGTLALVAGLASNAFCGSRDIRVIGYLPGWWTPAESAGWTLDSIDWDSLTHVIDSFARPLANGTIDASGLRGAPLIAKAHDNNTRCNVSIGGWSYRLDFYAPAQPAVIDTFVSNIYKLVVNNGYDGVDIDWEYPDRSAGGGLPAGSDQFNRLIRKIYERFHDPSAPRACDGKPLEVAFCQGTYYFREIDWPVISGYVDYVFVMGYDMDNPYNGPLRSGGTMWISTGVTIEKSVHGVCNYLVNKGVPRDKIVLGAPFYQTTDGSDYADVWSDVVANPSNYLGFVTSPGPFPGPAEARVNHAGTVVYMNDTNSFRYRCENITNNGYLGLGIWEITEIFPYTNLWQVIKRYKAPKAPAACGVVIPVTVSGIAPSIGCVGDTVVITGSNFLPLRLGGSVSFNGVKAVSYPAWSDTGITVVVPPGATAGKIAVTNYWGFGGTSPSDFTMPQAVVSAVLPPRGCVGEAVEIRGTGFGAIRGNGSVHFGGIRATNFLSWSDTNIVVTAPFISADAPVTVSNDCGTRALSSADFQVFCTNALSHFTVLHDGSAAVNSPEQFTVRAIDVRDNVKNDFTGRVTLLVRDNTGEIVWAVVTTNSTFVDGGPGYAWAVCDFRLSESGRMTFTVSDNTMESLDIEVLSAAGPWQDDDASGFLRFTDPLYDPSAGPFAYAYPNVFHKGESVVLVFVSPSSAIRIYDILGRLIHEIAAGETPRWTPAPGTAPGYYIAVYADRNGNRAQVRMIYTASGD